MVAYVALGTDPARGQHSVARQWNEVLLDAIRVDKPRPTVHARNLFHTSAALYDSWAAYDPTALGYWNREKLFASDVDAAREETMSYAAYRVLTRRFEHSPGAAATLAALDAKMDALGYDRSFSSTSGQSPAALGNRIAEIVLQAGMRDGANELQNYADTTGFQPLNPPLDVTTLGTKLVDAGQHHEHLAGREGEIAIYAWQGHPAEADGVGGVGWILAESWLPYQATNFVTPPFAAFSSGHSTFSRAAAEALAGITGDEFFPGGLGTFTVAANTLKFEGGPSEDVTLQWATYFDAADEAGISRLYGGIHVEVDDLQGRITGSQIGIDAYSLARSYFLGVPEPGTCSLLLVGCLLLPRRSRLK